MTAKAPTFQVTINDASETRVVNNDPPDKTPSAGKPAPKQEE